MSYRVAMVFLGSLALCACGDDHAHDHDHDHGEDPEAHACEHLEEGPFQQVAAAADVMMAPTVEGIHVAYDVTLQDDGAGNFGGVAIYRATEAAEFVFYADASVPIAFEDAAGAAVSPEGSCTANPCSSACAMIQARYALDLEAAAYTLRFGPYPAAQFRLLVEEASHAH